MDEPTGFASRAATRAVKEVRSVDVVDMELLIESTSFCWASILSC